MFSGIMYKHFFLHILDIFFKLFKYLNIIIRELNNFRNSKGNEFIDAKYLHNFNSRQIVSQKNKVKVSVFY